MDAEAATPAGTSEKKDFPEEHAVHKAFANQLVMGIFSMLSPDSRRCDLMISEFVDSQSDWQTEQSGETRSVECGRKWLLGQLLGGFVTTLCALFSQLSNHVFLDRLEFVFPTLGWNAVDLTPDDVQLRREDDMSRTLVRLNRGLYSEAQTVQPCHAWSEFAVCSVHRPFAFLAGVAALEKIH